MKIISFSGVDGSGKSTQRELLQKYLEEKGYKTAYFHATEFSLANRLHRKAKDNKAFTPGSEEAVTKAGFLSVFLRLVFLSIDGIRFHNYASCLQKSGVQAILSDRFFQDSLMNTAFLSQNPLIRALIRILANALPIPEYTFYLKLKPEDILNRERVPEQGREYLQEKINLYNNPPFCWVPHTLDAAQTPGTLHQAVLANIGDI